MKDLDKIIEYYDRGGIREVGRAITKYILTKSKISTKSTKSIYNNIAGRYYRKVLPHRGTNRFDCPLDPIKLIYVDPAEINKHTRRKYPHWNEKRNDVATVVDENWEIYNRQPIESGYEEEYRNINKIYQFDKKFNNSIFYKSLYNHFVEDVEWNQTELIQIVLDLIDNQIYVWQQCESQKEVSMQCDHLDRLYKKIDEDGYQTQYQIGSCGDILECYIEEVCVDIGPDGDFYLVDGRHRLAIARILGLEKIPVAVLARDKEWMKRRELEWNKEESIDHPDIQPYSIGFYPN